jgi:uncharacterized protein YukE
MSSPENIELNYDTASAAAGELKERAQAVETLAGDFQKAVEAFQADANLDGDVLPASKATLALLTEQASKVRTLIGEITTTIDHAGNALNGRVAESRSTEEQSTNMIDAIGALPAAGEGTPR